MGLNEDLLYKPGYRNVLLCFFNGYGINSPLSYSEIKKRSKLYTKDNHKLHNEQLNRCLRDFQKYNILEKNKEGRGYTLKLNKEEIESLRPDLISSIGLMKNKIKEANKHNISLLSNFTDRLLLEDYTDKTTVPSSQTTIYGLRKDIFYPTKGMNREFTKQSLPLIMGISKEDIFKDKYKIGVEEVIKNLLSFLEKQKKNYRTIVIESKFKELLKKRKYTIIRKFISDYIAYWIHFMNSTDVTKEFAEDYLNNKFWATSFRKIDYNKKEDINLLKSLISKGEKKSSIDTLKEKYNIFKLIQNKEIPYKMLDKLSNLSNKEKELLLDLIDETSNYLIKEELYPTKISIVGHTTNHLYII